jgi:hypothetical protein
MEPAAPLQKRVRNGWGLHDKHRKPESLYIIYGFYGPGCRFCSKRAEKDGNMSH